ncbi:unnamed protein product [Fraxinus pennsylvanica]|uniref:Inositol oxygenase n=1 Tax=Fraxinus pennsylvanica TaxID=56036 RepID=A0AAD2E9R8_9LAMI|nr:unnamed protein product [Fraxinus pennsylvanica]
MFLKQCETDYNVESERQEGVEKFYKNNHICQTYDFVRNMRVEYGKFDKEEMGIWECCELRYNIVDESDPALDEPRIQHLLQTAEAMRRDHPEEDWLHLTPLSMVHYSPVLHPKYATIRLSNSMGKTPDLGKILLHPKFSKLPQRAVVVFQRQNPTSMIPSTIPEMEFTVKAVDLRMF